MSDNIKSLIVRWLIAIVLLLSLLGLLTLSSCQKEEPLWKLPPPGDEEITQIAMGETYDNTVFYKFITNTFITANINTFHLAFESAANGYRIKINGGRNVQVYNTGSTDFGAVLSPATGDAWQEDMPSGNMDSTAVGVWLDTVSGQSKREVYVVSLGLNSAVKYKKFQLLAVDDTSYTVKYANPDNSEEKQVTFRKSTMASFTYFDFITCATVTYEPPAVAYDIVFTKYKHIFNENGEVIPYLVNGALLNPVNTTAVELDSAIFTQLKYERIAGLNFSKAANTIGYLWKTFDLEANKYSIEPNCYVVKDAEGSYWKMEFLDFYNDAGIKGYPKFRYQRL